MTPPRPDGSDAIDYDSPGFLARITAANRVILLFRASLDLALRNQWVESDKPWRFLKPFGIRKDGTALLASERARLEAILAAYRKPLSPLGVRMLYTGLRGPLPKFGLSPFEGGLEDLTSDRTRHE